MASLFDEVKTGLVDLVFTSESNEYLYVAKSEKSTLDPEDGELILSLRKLIDELSVEISRVEEEMDFSLHCFTREYSDPQFVGSETYESLRSAILSLPTRIVKLVTVRGNIIKLLSGEFYDVEEIAQDLDELLEE